MDKHIPEGIHAVVKSSEILEPGVIYVLKNVNTSVNINKLNRFMFNSLSMIFDDSFCWAVYPNVIKNINKDNFFIIYL